MKCLRERTIPDLPDSLAVTLHNPNICIAHLNIQGLKSKELCKSEDISLDYQMQKVDVMCLTETHWKYWTKCSSNDIDLSNSKTVYRYDRCGQGGAVVICAEETLEPQRLNTEETQIEIAGIQINKLHKNKCCVYLTAAFM